MITKRGMRNVRRARYRVKCNPIASYVDGIVPVFFQEVRAKNNYREIRFSDIMRIVHGITDYKHVEFSFIIQDEITNPMLIDINQQIYQLARTANHKVFKGLDVEDERSQIVDLKKEYQIIKTLSET